MIFINFEGFNYPVDKIETTRKKNYHERTFKETSKVLQKSYSTCIITIDNFEVILHNVKVKKLNGIDILKTTDEESLEELESILRD